MNIQSYIERLSIIRKLNTRKGRENFVNKDLYRILIKDEACLIDAYESIKGNKGVLTSAIDPKTLDGFGMERIEKIIQKLKDESWEPKPARRKYIPKPGKYELRPLGIQGPDEKIVQAAVKRILEAIYEPRFLQCSYGFRPKRGCHDALKYINQNFDNISYIIEGDIHGMYDNINHQKLIKLLENKINDARFIRLIWKLLRAGYMEINKFLIKSEIATPQGSIVSPILANIYLHELDLFMQKHVTQKQDKRQKIRTPEMKILISRKKKLTKLFEKAYGDERDKLLCEIRSVKWEMLNTKIYKNPINRIYFVRYADDFIIGVAGPAELADKLKLKIQEFLKSNLNLSINMEKTHITKARQKFKPVVFLGHELFVDISNKFTYVYAKNKTPFLKRTTGFLIRLQAPMKMILRRLHGKGFCNNHGIPKPKDIWTTQEDWIVVRNYNYILRGILNFYSGAHYQHRLGRVVYIMKYSCAMTLAKKHKSSIAKVFRKHGKSLTVSYKKKGKDRTEGLFTRDLTESSRVWLIGKQMRDPYEMIQLRLTKTDIHGVCIVCGNSSTEMHHIKHVRKGNKDTFEGILGIMNRKQVPLCKEHHIMAHRGLLDGYFFKQEVDRNE